MAQDNGLRNRFLRNTLILAIAIVIALISFNVFYITPSFTKLFVSGTRNDAMRIAMTETKDPDQGNLTVVMSDHPLELRQWMVVDAQQKPVTVVLQDPHYGVQLNPSLFLWTDQRSGPSFR